MKNKFLIVFFLLLSNFCFSQTNATNFNCNDCNGINHDLFSELNAGKVIVLCWVMPCSSCISPSRAAYDAVQSFTVSNPDRVYFYLADDYANTPCNTLTTWANNNMMPDAVKFSNAAVDMTKYGTPGMPKIVVVGGLTHKIFYNENNGANTAGIQPAITQALLESGIDDQNFPILKWSFIPNPVTTTAKLSFSLNEMTNVNIAIFDVFGRPIKIIEMGNQGSGEHETLVNLESFEDGIYFLRINAGETKKVIKFSIVH